MNISVKADGDALELSPPLPPHPLLAACASSLDLKHARIDGKDLPRSAVWSVTSLVPTQTNVEGEGNVPPFDPRSRSLSESPIALPQYNTDLGAMLESGLLVLRDQDDHSMPRFDPGSECQMAETAKPPHCNMLSHTSLAQSMPTG